MADTKETQAQLFPGGAVPAEVNQNDLAAILGLTTQRIHQLTAEGLPKTGRGRYPLAESVQWWVNFWKTKNSKSADNLESHRKRLIIAQAKRAEIDNDERQKQLIPVDLVASTLNQVAVIVASQLAALAPRLCNELTNQDDPAYVKKILDEETRQIRIAISNTIDDLAATQNSGDDNQTAADQNSEPVGRPGTDLTT